MRTFTFLVTDGTLNVKSFLGFILSIIIENILGDVVNYIIMTIFILNLPVSLTTHTVFSHKWKIFFPSRTGQCVTDGTCDI